MVPKLFAVVRPCRRVFRRVEAGKDQAVLAAVVLEFSGLFVAQFIPRVIRGGRNRALPRFAADCFGCAVVDCHK